MLRKLSVALLGLVLASCIPAALTPTPIPPTSTPLITLLPSPTATATLPPEGGLPSPAAPQLVSFPAPDGTQLAAFYYPPLMPAEAAVAGKPAPGILLVHMVGRTHADWDSVALSLQRQGYAVLALDLRGHGASGGTADWSQMPGDVRAAWDFLVSQREVNGQRAAIIGASIGANLALIVGANNPSVATVVALSPGLNYHGLAPAELLSNFGQRPILLVASQDDEYAYTSVQALAPRAPAAQTHYLATAGHGTDMFADLTLEPLILEWLQRYLGEMKG